jgi:hypothetical protein
MSLSYLNFKHSESYKENYLLKKSVLALTKIKNDPISHKTSDKSKLSINNFRPSIKVSIISK